MHLGWFKLVVVVVDSSENLNLGSHHHILLLESCMELQALSKIKRKIIKIPKLLFHDVLGMVLLGHHCH